MGLWRAAGKTALSLEQKILALGGALWVEAKEVYAKAKVAVQLDGTNDYMQSTDATILSTLDGTNAFTFACCVNADVLDGVNGDGLIATYDVGNSRGVYVILFGAKIDVIVADTFPSNAIQVRSIPSHINTATDHFIFVDYDGSKSASGINVYEGTTSLSTIATTSLAQTSFTGSASQPTAWIGQYGSAAASRIQGKLDQDILFDKVLSAAERDAIVNGGDGLNYADLSGSESYFGNIVYWKDHSDINDLGKDSSVNGRDWTLFSLASTDATLGHICGAGGDSDTITKHLDRSLNGNDLCQSTPDEAPIWINGDIVRYTGDSNLDSAQNVDFSGAFTIVLRSRHSDVTEASDLIATDATIYSNDATGKPSVFGVTAGTALTNNTYATIAVKCDGAPSVGTISFRKDGVADGTPATRNSTAVTDTLLQLGDITLTQNWDFKGLYIQEGLLSDDDIALIEQRFLTL